MTLIKVLLHHWIKAVFIVHLNVQSTSIMQIVVIEKLVIVQIWHTKYDTH